MKRYIFVVFSLLCPLRAFATDVSPDYIGDLIQRFGPEKPVSKAKQEWKSTFNSSCSREYTYMDCIADSNLPKGIEKIWLRMEIKDISERQLVIDLTPGIFKTDQESKIITKFPYEKGTRTDQRPHANMTQTDVRFEPETDNVFRGQYQFNFNDDGWIRSIASFWSNIQCSH